MPDQFFEDPQGHVFAHGEDAPEVQGHIRRSHTVNEISVPAPEESIQRLNDEDDGPDVEGHFFL